MKNLALLICSLLMACDEKQAPPPAPVAPNAVERTRQKLDAAQQEEQKRREEIDREVK